MATQTITFSADADLTLTAIVYPVGSNTSFATPTVTEETRDGVYSFTLSNSAGRYEIHVSETAGLLGVLYVETTNTTTTYAAADSPFDLDHSASFATLLTRIPSTLFSGITSLANWLGSLAGKTADTTTRAEINVTTAGAGYNETTDSQEAIRDRGDTAWITGSGGGGGGGNELFTDGQLDQLRGIEFTGPTSVSSEPRQIVAGDDYAGTRVLKFISDALPDLSAASSLTFSLRATDKDRTLKITATTVAFAETPRRLEVTLTSTQTRLAAGWYDADIEAVVASKKQTVVGPKVRFEVLEDQTR